jgi:hypothetical protein
LYGIKNQLDTPDNINKIWENASFSLTWRGFKLKTNDGNGSVTIDTENDFVVFNEENIKII